MEKISIGQAVDKYLSGDIKERFLGAMEAENDLGLDAEVDDNPSTLISSSFIWEDTKEGGKFWIDVANAIFKNPMFYAPKPGQTFRDFAKKYLSGDIYKQFINNCVMFNSQDYLDRVPTSIKEDSVDYFYAPFVWSDSPEGHDYWYEAAEKFKKDTTVFQFKPYVWVVFSEDSMRLLDVFSSEEEATKCWDGCSGYVIKKFVQEGV